MANLDDIATIQKNGVLGVNALTEALSSLLAEYKKVSGTTSYLGVSNDSLLVQGSGRLVRISVAVDGSTDGSIHDCASVAAATDANRLATIVKTHGVYEMGIPYSLGLVVKPGTGMVATVVYSEDT